ncbi:MAG: hypothetical protein M3O70_21560 [Actinomycetota bacterium]|nr:hypothetical protein [Actinomycetota bacterium]
MDNRNRTGPSTEQICGSPLLRIPPPGACTQCRHLWFGALWDALADDLVAYLVERPDLADAWLEWVHSGVDVAARDARKIAREMGAAA